MEHLWENDQPDRCEHCGAGDDAHHSYTCPTGKHPDREFQPEYFSGLNWRDIELGKKYQYSDDGQNWTPTSLQLTRVFDPATASNNYRPFQSSIGMAWFFARTCPETYAHPTIRIGDVDLPMPETEAPEFGRLCWLWRPGEQIRCLSWIGDGTDLNLLRSQAVHLIEARAKAWADWWSQTVMAQTKGAE